MSIKEQIKSLFSRKASNPADDDESRLSLATPGVTSLSDAQETVQPAQTAPVTAPGDEGAGDGESDGSGVRVSLMLLGRRTVAQHQAILVVLIVLGLVGLLAFTGAALSRSDTTSQQLRATTSALVQSQRLGRSVTQAITGNGQAFRDVADSSASLFLKTRALAEGDSEQGISPLPEELLQILEGAKPSLDRSEKAVAVILKNEKLLSEMGSSLKLVHNYSDRLQQQIELLESSRSRGKLGPAEVAAFSRLKLQLQRMGNTASEMMMVDGTDDLFKAAKGMEMDLSAFGTLSREFLGAADRSTLTPEEVQLIQDIQGDFEQTQVQAQGILKGVQQLQVVRQSFAAVVTSSELMRLPLQNIEQVLSERASLGAVTLGGLTVCGLMLLLGAVGLYAVQLRAAEAQQQLAQAQQQQAERQEQDAKRVNDANQAAILRLMNELQSVAEGDLTQEATVTEDITGAIADSVNYTVEELRSLVASVQSTASRVAQTTTDVDVTSTELLAASNEQLHEIRETGRSVLDMAQRINEVSAQAQESARVARQSLQAAETGLQAVQNSIGGMNAIRDQIQETSKRIKRLGESSQEIGEITELISDITEQTNVLALNAAIQAASAGEAGRGFSVVAEEVQRLAERSADATRQIAALVKAIQTDTQDAIGAMERSTQGVVEGAKLSDNTGSALAEIERVTRRVADLIEQISGTTSREASLANVVAENIQHIFAVTEQTGDGTRSTAAQVRELSQMAEELRQSVARFKIS